MIIIDIVIKILLNILISNDTMVSYRKNLSKFLYLQVVSYKVIQYNKII